MILAIRIRGLVEIPKKVNETLDRMRLRRKYAAVLFKSNQETVKLLKRVRDYIAYGDIDDKTLLELLEKRAQPIKKDTKIDAKKIAAGLDSKKPEDLGIKPFFRLHPPRGGIDAKKHFGVSKKAVLGDNKKAINELVRRML